MSDTSQNLIEIQSLLQNPAQVSMQDLMNYANGSNPSVPSFLALMELSRRSQIEKNSQEFNRPQGSVKDQTIAALLDRRQSQPANPTLPAQGASLASAQPMVNPAEAAQQVNPTQAQQQVDPTAMPIQAARGGLMTIPVKNMFKAKSYATGGIVAFDEGGPSNKDEYVEDRPGHYVLRSELEQKNGQKYPPRATYKLGNQTIQGPRSIEEIVAGLPAIKPLQGSRPEDMTVEQAAARQKEIQRVAGVSEDPYADARAYQKSIEERQAQERKGNVFDRFLAQAEAFAAADPTKGFGYQAAASSKATRALEAEQRALQEKQDAVSRDFRLNQAKEDDARRRGDATGIAGALQKQKEDQAAYDRLEMDKEKLEQQRYTNAGNIFQSDVTASKIPLDFYQAESTRRSNESTADYNRRMAKVNEDRERRANEEKPTVDDINYQRIMARVNSDPEIKALANQTTGMDPSSPEYQQIQMAIYNKMKTYFAAYPRLLPPAPRPVAPLPARPRTGWGWNSRPAPTPNAVPFESLPR
jgi:hypothetical protein